MLRWGSRGRGRVADGQGGGWVMVGGRDQARNFIHHSLDLTSCFFFHAARFFVILVYSEW